jgi:hypothetical protein
MNENISSILFEKYIQHLIDACDAEKVGNVEMRKYHIDLAGILIRVCTKGETI